MKLRNYVLRTLLIIPLLIVHISVAHAQGPVNPCGPAFNFTLGPFPYGSLGTAYHITGAHFFSTVQGGTCEYRGATKCDVASSSYSHSTVSDNGLLSVPLVVHQQSVSDHQGVNFAFQSGSTKSDAEGAGGVAQCGWPSCGFSISVNGSGQGGGFTVTTGGAAPLWSDKKPFITPCPGETYDNNSCGAANLNDINPCGPSPIIIDATGKGFHFTDPAKQCVLFDILGNDKPQCVSWPEDGSGDAWLVLPNEKGEVLNINQLFGDHSPHSDGGLKEVTTPSGTVIPTTKNGFLALAWYDQFAQGGDFNLVLDSKDSIFGKLRLWFPEHCLKEPTEVCHSLPHELHTLAEFGIDSFGLMYEPSKMKDSYGNAFRFRARMNLDRTATPEGSRYEHLKSQDSRYAYDVYLAVRK
jgi:hypothetical protein